MDEAPSLHTLCIEAIKRDILPCGDDLPPHIYELPEHLFDSLLRCLPPVALQKLQECMPSRCDEDEFSDDSPKSKRQCTRNLKFNTGWRKLYKARWPLTRQKKTVNWLAKQVVETCKLTNDWQQMYWEAHLQDCLDEVAEVALLPKFGGSITEINIPDYILQLIGLGEHKSCSICDCAKLSYHCQRFAFYARYLKLQKGLCVEESYNLLKTSKLHRLDVHGINSKEHVIALCKVLNQSRQTLRSLELIRCTISSASLHAICGSLYNEGCQTHAVEHFAIKASYFSEIDRGLASFLSSGRSLTSLIFCDNDLPRNFAKIFFSSLLDAAWRTSILDGSENNSSSGLGRPYQSLSMLNLRGNDLRKSDTTGLKSVLAHMPNLEILDISDNPIEDDGIKRLLPGLVEMLERCSHLKDLRIGHCELSCAGLNQLLEVLLTSKHCLDSLSLAENGLGREAGTTLGKFLRTGIKALDIEDIGLDSSGFLGLQAEIKDDLKLVYINMSKNRGSVEAVRFMVKLIERAPELVAVNAGYNFIPFESLSTICSSMEAAKELGRKLKRVDLTGHTWSDQPDAASMLSKFRIDGESIFVLSSSTAPYAPYDADP